MPKQTRQAPKTKQHTRKIKQRKPRRALRLATRRARIAEMLLLGRTYRDMAHAVGVRSTQTIFADVKAVIAEWRETQQHHVSEWVSMELERIGRVESQAWEAWERSREDAVIDSVEKFPKFKKTKHVAKGQAGNPSFLDVVLRCVQRRCELLGLDAPKDINVPGLLTPEEIEKRRVERFQRALPALEIALMESRKDESDSNA